MISNFARFTRFGFGYDLHTRNDPQASPDRSATHPEPLFRFNVWHAESIDHSIAYSATRRTQSESIDDYNAHFVLGYN